jgi:iron-sulfur cluster assembly accessory protein
VLRVRTVVLRSAASYIKMIQFTDKATERITKVLEAGEAIRIAVQGGGCSGMSYCLNIETEEPDEEDILLDIPAVKIYIDPMSAGILKDTTVDYIATLQQEGFVFNNPAANTTCGCGSSFS